jgi:hypothetical protein
MSTKKKIQDFLKSDLESTIFDVIKDGVNSFRVILSKEAKALGVTVKTKYNKHEEKISIVKVDQSLAC